MVRKEAESLLIIGKIYFFYKIQILLRKFANTYMSWKNKATIFDINTLTLF